MATKKKLNYNGVAKNIIAGVGGKENITNVRHCITRVRFRLKDEGIVDDEVVKNLEGVISVVHGGGEYMIVIGNAVIDVYNAVCEQLGKLEKTEGQKQENNVNPVLKLLTVIVGTINPCLNLICAGGIIKGLLTILEMSKIVEAGTGIDTLISAAGDGIFYFLPIFLGMNLAKNLKGDMYLGALIGAILCHPAINGADLSIFGINFNYTYTSSFLPVIAIVALAVPLAKFLKKYVPGAVANFLVPVITLLIVIPLGYCIIGPAMGIFGSLVNTGITAMMDTVPVLAGAVFGGLYQIMVLFGIHQALTSFSFMSLLGGTPDAIMAICCTVCFSQIGVVLAIYLKTKDKNLKAVALPAFISGLFGITEPAIYGVTLPRIKMFIISCVGGAVCGAFIMLTKTYMYSFGLGVFAVIGLLNPENPQIVTAVLSAVIPFAFSFAVAFLMYKDNVIAEKIVETDEKEVLDSLIDGKLVISAPVLGEVLDLSKVPDDTFSAGLLGNGFAVEPVEGKVYAPFNGTCDLMFETLHAMGLTSENGVSILIHVGLETVSLGGKPFKAHVKSGDAIKKGQLLLEFNIDEIKAAECPIITPVIVTNGDEVGEVAVKDNKIIVG